MLLWILSLLMVQVVNGVDVEIIAHRGESFDAPENTMAAFELAWSRGINSFELDCRLTKDGQLVVIHDADTKRTSPVAKAVAEATAAELGEIDAGKWKDPKFAGVKYVCLPEVFAKMPHEGRCFVEVKVGPEAVPALVQAIQRSGRKLEQFAVIGFNAEMIAETKRQLPQVTAYWISSFKQDAAGEWSPTVDALVAEAKRIRADGLDVSAKGPVDREFVSKVKAAGLGLYVWTVDDLAVAQRLIASGVDGITTNKGLWLRESLATSVGQ